MINIERFYQTDTATFGRLYINGGFVCYTLEDKVRQVKIYGETAIPAGEYKCKLTYSNKFKKTLPLIYNTPDYKVKKGLLEFGGVRIHGGNNISDTFGCVLTGEVMDLTKEIIYKNATKKIINYLCVESKEVDLIIENKFENETI